MYAFDVDGITLASHPILVEEVNRIMDTNLTIDDWSDYDITKKVGMTEEAFVRMYQGVLERTDIPLQPYAARILVAIHQHSGEFLKFVTARSGKWVRSAEKNLINGLTDVPHPDGSGKTLPTPELMVFNGTNGDPHTGSKVGFLVNNGIRFFMEDNPAHWEEYMDNYITIGTFPFPWCKKEIDRLQPKYGAKLRVFSDWNDAGTYIIQHIIDGTMP